MLSNTTRTLQATSMSGTGMVRATSGSIQEQATVTTPSRFSRTSTTSSLGLPSDLSVGTGSNGHITKRITTPSHFSQPSTASSSGLPSNLSVGTGSNGNFTKRTTTINNFGQTLHIRRRVPSYQQSLLGTDSQHSADSTRLTNVTDSFVMGATTAELYRVQEKLAFQGLRARRAYHDARNEVMNTENVGTQTWQIGQDLIGAMRKAAQWKVQQENLRAQYFKGVTKQFAAWTTWEDDIQLRINKWRESGCPDVPEARKKHREELGRALDDWEELVLKYLVEDRENGERSERNVSASSSSRPVSSSSRPPSQFSTSTPTHTPSSTPSRYLSSSPSTSAFISASPSSPNEQSFMTLDVPPNTLRTLTPEVPQTPSPRPATPSQTFRRTPTPTSTLEEDDSFTFSPQNSPGLRRKRSALARHIVDNNIIQDAGDVRMVIDALRGEPRPRRPQYLWRATRVPIEYWMPNSYAALMARRHRGEPDEPPARPSRTVPYIFGPPKCDDKKPEPATVQPKAFRKASKPVSLKHRMEEIDARFLARQAGVTAARIARDWLGDAEDREPAPVHHFELGTSTSPAKYELDATPATVRYELDATPAPIRSEIDATPAPIRQELDAAPAPTKTTKSGDRDCLCDCCLRRSQQQSEGIVASLKSWAGRIWGAVKQTFSNFNFMEN